MKMADHFYGKKNNNRRSASFSVSSFNKALLMSSVVLAAAAATPSFAQTYYDVSGDVTPQPDVTQKIWNAGAVKVGQTGDGYLNLRSAAVATVSSMDIAESSSLGYSGLTMGSGSHLNINGTLNVGVSGRALMQVNDNTRLTTTGATVIGGNSGSDGELRLIHSAEWNSYGDIIVGNAGKGHVSVAMGSRITSGSTRVGVAAGSTQNSIGIYDGSTWENSGSFQLGVGSGAHLSINGATSSLISVSGLGSDDSGLGINAGSVATAIIDGGKWENTGRLYVGQNGSGTVTIDNSGALSSTGIIILGSSSDGFGRVELKNGGTMSAYTVLLGEWGASSSGEIDVHTGGKLDVTNLYVGFDGQGVVKLHDGGIIEASLIWLSVSPVSHEVNQLIIGDEESNAARAAGTIAATSLLLSSSNSQLVLNHTETDYIINAEISSNAIPGATIKQLAGVTRLKGDSQFFEGTTQVSGGKLIVDNQLGGTVQVTGNALKRGTLTGEGTVRGAATFTGGILEGETGRELLFTNNLSLDADSHVNITLSGAPSNDRLFTVTGDLTLAGTLNVTDGGGLTAGVYRLFDHQGTRTGDFSTINVSAGVGTTQFAPNYVNLVVVTGSVNKFWDGGDASKYNNNIVDGGDGVWQLGDLSWTVADGSANEAYSSAQSFAIFQGTAGTVTIDDTAGAIKTSGMQFAVDGYLINGDSLELNHASGETIVRVGVGAASDIDLEATILSDITGASQLVKKDLGTLILGGTNSYTGGTRIDDGTIAISSDANLGDAAGDVTLAGGTLAITNDMGSSRDFVVDGTGTVSVHDDVGVILTGVVSGTGAFAKDGEGTLTLGGNNTYEGGTHINGGTLVISSDSNLGAATGGLTFNGGELQVTSDLTTDRGVTFTDTGTISVENGANVTLGGAGSGAGGLVKTGDGTLTLGDNIKYTGNTEIADGSLILDQTTDHTYGGVFSGSGSLVKSGSGTLTLTGDSSGFAGSTTVTSGSSLFIDALAGGALGGAIDVASGATFGGNGAIGSAGQTITINSGATHDLGSQIATQSFAGNYANHGTLRIKATPDAADKIVVAGSVDITGAQLELVLSPDNRAMWKALNGPYTIIDKQSAGAVVGTFASPVHKNLLFLHETIAYDGGDGNDVTLKLERNTVDFVSVAVSGNQTAIATSLDKISQDNPVWRAIAGASDENEVRTSFDALSGEVHASVRSSMIEDSRWLRNTANQRVRASFDSAAAAPTMPLMAFGPDSKPIAVAADYAGPVMWAEGFGGWGRTSGDGNAATSKRSGGGLLIGADTLVGDVRLGVISGYSQTDIMVNDRASGAKSKNIHLGAYGGGEWGNVTFNSAVAYTWHDISSNRHVVVPGLNETLSANYNGGTVQAFGEVAYKVAVQDVRFEPFANLAYVSVRTNGFGETGGNAALNVSGRTSSTTFTTLGMRMQHDLTLGAVDAVLSGSAGWRYAFNQTGVAGIHAFSGSDTFAISGTPVARNNALLEAGVDFKISPAAALGIFYTGQLSKKSQDHGLRAGFNVKL